MKRCTCDQSLLLEFALGELEPSQRPRVAAQVRDCPICASEVRSHQELAKDLARLPQPVFPIPLEEVLVRSAIQARRVLAVLVLILSPANLVGTGSGVDEVVYGGAGRGATAFQDLVRLYANIRQGWEILVEFLGKLTPVWRALRALLGAVGVLRAGIAVLSVLAVVMLLWRWGRPRRKMGHANAR
jgi:anti-sigma factor RsiW